MSTGSKSSAQSPAVLKKTDGAENIGYPDAEHGTSTVAAALNNRPPVSAKNDIIIAYGQSNSIGYAGQPGSPAADDSATPAPGARSYHYDFSSGNIETISNTMAHANYDQEGTSSRGNGWTAFANRWNEMTNRGCVFVSCGRGGATIAQLQKSNTTPISGDVDPDYYQRLIDGYAAAKTAMTAAGLEIGNTYLVFHQGETDQSDGTNAVTYRNALNDLASDLFADIAELKKIGVYIVGCPDSRNQYDWERIQSAQWSAVRYAAGAGNDKNMAVISDVCPTFTLANGQYNPVDGTHYSQRGYNEMGDDGARNLHQWVTQASYSAAEKDAEKTARINGINYRPMQMIAGMAAWSPGTGWILLRDANTGGTIYPCYVQRIDLISTGIRFVFSGKAPIAYGYWADVNLPGLENQILTDVKTWTASNEWGLDVHFYADLEFGVDTTTGALLEGSPLVTAASGGMIDTIISTSGAGGGQITLTHPPLKHTPRVGYYSSPALEAGSAGVRGNLTTQTNVMVSGVSDTLTVSMSRVPLNRPDVEALSSFTLRIMALVSDNL